MPAEKISLEHAKSEKLFYFVANVVVFRPSDGKCLILKRSESEKVHPGKWCVPGGKLEWNDLDISKPTRMNGEVFDFENALEDLLARESLEEAGIVIDKANLRYINSVAFVRPDGIPVMLVKCAAKFLSGKIRLEKGSFTDAAWVDGAEVDQYSCIKGVPDEVRTAIDLFSL